MIKLLTIFSVLVFSTFSLAQLQPPIPMPQPIDVEIYVNLNVEKECRITGDMSLCDATISDIVSSITIRLYPQTRGYCIPSDSGPCDNDGRATSYRGLWSKVVENDSYRAIAIVSIDRNTYNDGNGPVTSFTLTVEVIDDQGHAGKMVTTVNSLDQLSRTSLYGRQASHRGGKYTSIVSIGRAIRVCPIGDTCNKGLVKSDEEGQDNIWNVELGTIL